MSDSTLTAGSRVFDIDAIRADFPILQRKINDQTLVYLDTAATSQKPKQVIEALTNYYEQTNANVHRGVHTLSIEATDGYELARTKVAKFINAVRPEEVIWTRNTSESLNLVAATWAEANVGEGDNIVITAMEHHSNIVPWQHLAEKKNAELRYLAADEDGLLDISELDSIVDSRTKIVAATHMSNVLGSINPIAELANRAHAVGAVILVDAAQSVPHMPVDVQALDADFLCFSAHKMLGPTGIGVLWGRYELLEVMPPYMFGGDMILEVTYENATWNDLPYKFEAGTPNIADAIATGAAVDYLTELGMDNVWQHEQELTAYAMEQILSLDSVKVLGPQDSALRGGVISFIHGTIHPHDLGTALDQQGIAIRTGHHCAMPLVRSFDVVAAARASFYIYNTKSEIDALVNGISETERYFSRCPVA
ncbi:MAG: cysteine desulfurase [Dehalococcoidia bacterium]|jgi:cysteine desulfurase/selenocysteine lyase|nr:cysteine desulfurase [Chloroflexota bacterium]MDP6056602.1 cysteine desulfurase [Dehalococcoidia bacterium]MDP7090816.1 cysteine desulfurase [Dehalococcoidia bacterium]MDP7262633.1 cysteine desulfurase [Dehalococcoidia bacterium]MDP7485994.1 cysteine desulfurase [Dehalococcoidia bacterium]|tara:strand:+ start:3915 stop:5186 length:1272 start_codon:yes stop_codon:yes gene_type:complete